jgi:hypothetical protein
MCRVALALLRAVSRCIGTGRNRNVEFFFVGQTGMSAGWVK